MLVRLLIFLAIVAAIFIPLNWIVIRSLLRIHPRRRRAIIGIAVVCNLMWPLLPFLRKSNEVMRVLRATLAPPWFSWVMFLLLYAALLLIVALIWIPYRTRRPFAQFAHLPSKVFLSILILAAIPGYYAALVPLRVETVRIAIPGLAPEAVGTRLALVSDLHVGLFTRPSRLEKIFATVESVDPHAVLIAGDFIDDDPHFVAKLLRALAPLRADRPAYAVLGNHEMYGDPDEVIASLQGSRLRLLVNEGRALRGLWIAGLTDPAAGQEAQFDRLKPDFDRALHGRHPTETPVILAHQPRLFEEAAKRGVPLTLVGHTHGGQFGIRPLGWSLAGVFLPYHMGRYRKGDAQLYVNTGTGYWVVPFRLGMTPEITVIELTSGRNAE